MLLLLCSWLMIALVFLSCGSMVGRTWCQLTKQESSFSVFDTFWMGIAAVGVLLSILSIFVPLTIHLLVGLVAISFFYASIHCKQLMEQLKKSWIELTVKPIEFKLALALSLIVISLFSLTTPLLYDQGLYHLQSMQWSEQYSVIPGLGNLHGRLAFNSSFLLLSTLFNYHPLYFSPFFSINSLCLIVFAVWMLLRIRTAKTLIQKGVLVLILVLCIFYSGIYLSATSTDILGYILTLYLLLSCVLDKHFFEGKILLLVLLPLFCLTVKLSTAPILLLTLVAFVYLIKSKEYRLMRLLIAISLLIIVPWLARFVLLSGYLVYPFAAIDIFSFDWKIPIEWVRLEKDLAFTWAVTPDMDASIVAQMSVIEWMPIWWGRLSVFNRVLYLLAIISPFIIRWRYKSAKQQPYLLLAWAVALLGVLFSLSSAPDPRFSFSYILCAAFIPLLLLDPLLGSKKRIRELAHKIVPFTSFLLLLSLCILAYIAYNQTVYYQDKEQNLTSLLYQPQSIDYKKNEAGEIFASQQVDHIAVYYPTHSNRCYDHPLPCIPYANTNLEMRGENIQEGFRVKED